MIHNDVCGDFRKVFQNLFELRPDEHFISNFDLFFSVFDGKNDFLACSIFYNSVRGLSHVMHQPVRQGQTTTPGLHALFFSISVWIL